MTDSERQIDMWSAKCLDCTIPKDIEEKQACGLHWRPGSGTKAGFPVEGWECPKDTYESWYTVTLKLPCAPGDSVFMLIDGSPRKFIVKRFSVFDAGLNWIMHIQAIPRICDSNGNSRSYYEAIAEEIGKTVFLTMEDAIAELRKEKHETTDL